MEEQPFKTTKHQRVRLKLNGEDGVYPKAYAGSEGWVRDQRYDDLGYPLVLIEWDKNHWTYSGESDKWTFESHFDPIEESNMDNDIEKTGQPLDPQAFGQMMEAFGQFLQQQQQEPGTKIDVKETPPEAEQRATEQYKEALRRGTDAASEAEAFLLLSIHKDPQGTWIPIVSSASLQDEAGLLAEMQIAKLASEITTQLTIEVLARRESDES